MLKSKIWTLLSFSSGLSLDVALYVAHCDGKSHGPSWHLPQTLVYSHRALIYSVLWLLFFVLMSKCVTSKKKIKNAVHVFVIILNAPSVNIPCFLQTYPFTSLVIVHYNKSWIGRGACGVNCLHVGKRSFTSSGCLLRATVSELHFLL